MVNKCASSPWETGSKNDYVNGIIHTMDGEALRAVFKMDVNGQTHNR
jgi:hypothetical protein